ncbi:MAG: hypothetical protein ACD_41C00382G0004 [uncultured bacterium]|nr:MAG: hypothetical protein ACD_41C00382G0004 [uncultured bacterium]HBY73949.1 hypothetical protein [Candidatus Kerfeldbacteria bacterium]
MVIALTGEKLAGKGTVAEYLQRTRQARVLRFSQPLTDILARLHQPNSRAELVALGGYLRERFGDDVLARVICSDIRATGDQLTVIDGLRYEAELLACRQLPTFYLLNVTAPVDIRFSRMQFRQEKADELNMSYAEFVQREQDVTEREIAQVQQQAGMTIHNTGTKQDLYNAVDQWLATLPH